MKREDRSTLTCLRRMTDSPIARRAAMGSSGLAVLGVLAGSALGQTEEKETEGKKSPLQLPKEIQERMEKSKAFSERLRNADSMEERQQIMNEQRAWQRQKGIDKVKDELRVSEQEWAVIKPRFMAVYDLVRPVVVIEAGKNAPPKTELEQRDRELRELVQADKADMDQIKAKLAAYRAAKERANQELAKARQALRQIMNLRQEAVLVLNGLLD